MPTDHSPSARQALVLAAEMASTYRAELIILHVGSRGAEVPEPLEVRAREALDQARAAGELPGDGPARSPDQPLPAFVGRVVLEEARGIATRHGVAAPSLVLDFGDSAERVLSLARQRAVDMIVMGSHGHGVLKEILLGSLPNKVRHLASCTTVTVRQPGERAEEGFRTVLAATDGSAHGNRAVTLACDLAGRTHARLVLLHVLLRDVLPDRVRGLVDPALLSEAARAELESEAAGTEALRYAALPTPLLSAETLAEVGHVILARARAEAAAAGVADVETIVLEGDPTETVVEQADVQAADLVVVGSRGLGPLEGILLGSVSNKVSHLLTCPCVVVR